MYNSEKRKQYLINKEFQFKFIIKVYVAIFISIVAVGGFLFYFNDKTLSFSAYQQVLSMKSAREMLFPTILSISLVTAVVALIIVIFRFILESHRIVGPMYRFERGFEALEKGDLTINIKLREKDEMQDLSKKFNDMVSSLNSYITKSKNTVNRLKEVSVEKDGANEDIQKLINELDEELSLIRTSKG